MEFILKQFIKLVVVVQKPHIHSKTQFFLFEYILPVMYGTKLVGFLLYCDLVPGTLGGNGCSTELPMPGKLKEFKNKPNAYKMTHQAPTLAL